MENKELFSSYKDYVNKEISVKGWIKKSRESKNVGFLEINDGTFFENVQIIVNSNLENFKEIFSLGLYAAVEVTGVLVEPENAKQDFEIQANKISIINNSTKDYPLQNKRHTFEYLRTLPHLRMRTNAFNAVFRVRSELAYAIHKFFNERGFLYVHTPIITASDAEGAGEMFRVTTLDLNNLPKDDQGKVDNSKDFFGAESNLTVSGQLEAEGFVMAYSKVYTFGPTFRAENSNTPRHAAEFWMMEPEIAYCELKDVMNLAEDMVKYIVKHVLDKLPEEMKLFDSFVEKGLIDRLTKLVNSEFKHVTYTEAIDLLEKSGKKFEYPVEWGSDLQTEHERYLSEEVFNGPVFVTDYPKDFKSFYMKLNDDGKTVQAMDMLVPGVGELIGGSQREDNADKLLQMMEEKGIKKEDYEWYTNLRRFGGVPHGGFGLGFERMVMYVTGMKNIRDVIPYPRTVNSMKHS
ncbi:asparagine--tRNA ligase [Helcococcus kunzii]|uniref:Asparagine--tRNA ligase n=1 Tax=Helcococcus kunzii ATCC 51366 TaxID=883114 RepID=H3NNK4_9FIRM|nr:asparagine--tRNA ligase [Helcococcus kunzii]EHR33979.1 asparagine-tRNA ligase [Helcococcus kunzii ATCC 51366]QUY64830.1 asparagine--tRNA ligase [Helcococcus kunzii]